MGLDLRGSLPRVANLMACALLLPSFGVRADGPRTIAILTSVSTDGAVVVELGGVEEGECARLAATARVTGPVDPIQVEVETFGTCRHRVAPETALPPGEYCVEIPDAQLQQQGPPCFQVTGTTAQTMGSSVSVESDTAVGKLGLDERSCTPCQGAIDDRTCTRERRAWLTRASVEDVAGELASTHVFSIQTRMGRAPVELPVPDATAEWSALPTELVYALAVPIPDPGEEACVGVYSRPAGGGPALLLGRSCLEAGDEAATLPAIHVDVPQACANAYGSRWCDDNRADCRSAIASALFACDAFDQLCAGSDAGMQPTAADAGGGTAGHDADSSTPLPPAQTRPVHNGDGCGCQLFGHGPGKGRGPLVIGGTVLALAIVRSRRASTGP